MTVPMPRQDQDPRPTRRVDARPLWSGGVATAVVAGLIALVGILVARWLFKVPILSPRREGHGDKPDEHERSIYRMTSPQAGDPWPDRAVRGEDVEDQPGHA